MFSSMFGGAGSSAEPNGVQRSRGGSRFFGMKRYAGHEGYQVSRIRILLLVNFLLFVQVSFLSNISWDLVLLALVSFLSNIA